MLKLDQTEFECYFDCLTSKLRFNGQPLLTEIDYQKHLPFSAEVLKLFEEHERCPICTASYQKKRELRKRKKVDRQDLCDIVADVATGRRYEDICKRYKVSKTTIKNINSRRRLKQLNRRSRSIGPTALSKFDQCRLISLVEESPFNRVTEIKQRLQLTASPQTITRFLRQNGYSLHTPIERPFLFPHHVRQRDSFAKLIKDVDQEIIDRLVFTDEKTIHNVHIGKVKVIRKRGKGLDKR